MEIQRTSITPAFTAKFIPNKAFKEVVDYAAETKQLRALDSALNNINKANDGDILITHGQTASGVFSNFTLKRRSSVNLGANCSPAEASFNGILELGQLGRKFRSLFGGNVKECISPADIIKNYTSAPKI